MVELDFVIRLLVVSVFVAALGMVAIYEAFRAVMAAKDSQIVKLINERNAYWDKRFDQKVEPLNLESNMLKVSRMEIEHRGFEFISTHVKKSISHAFAEEIQRHLFFEVFNHEGVLPLFGIKSRLKILPMSKKEMQNRIQEGKYMNPDYPLDAWMTERINADLLKEVHHG
ncbi:MAG: hypothetical protein RIC30_09460 [Marinoscillum sp.]|uniref:hypothetical protein n=1 Tax=Marinoscillum sp. TaxID=2024838 RepID=UPI0032F6162E